MKIRVTLAAIVSTLLLATCLLAQEHPSCWTAASNPSPTSPTVSDATDTANCGVLVMETNWTRQWPGAGGRDDAVGALFRLGLRPNLELRWATDGALFSKQPASTISGLGETYLGGKYRILEQSAHFPSLALRYTLKIPTASTAKGFSTGYSDHEIGVLLSKDFRPIHLDLSALQLFCGRGPGQDLGHTTRLAFSGTRALTQNWGGFIEAYGELPLEKADPAFAGSIAGLSYRLSSKLVLFSAVDLALTDHLPREQFMVSISYAITNFYSLITHREISVARRVTEPSGAESGRNSVQ